MTLKTYDYIPIKKKHLQSQNIFCMKNHLKLACKILLQLICPNPTANFGDLYEPKFLEGLMSWQRFPFFHTYAWLYVLIILFYKLIQYQFKFDDDSIINNYIQYIHFYVFTYLIFFIHHSIFFFNFHVKYWCLNSHLKYCVSIKD